MMCSLCDEEKLYLHHDTVIVILSDGYASKYLISLRIAQDDRCFEKTELIKKIISKW